MPILAKIRLVSVGPLHICPYLSTKIPVLKYLTCFLSALVLIYRKWLPVWHLGICFSGSSLGLSNMVQLMWCKLSNLTCWTPAAVWIFPARAYCTARTPLARSLKLDTRCRSVPRVAVGELLLELRRGLSFPAGFLPTDVLPFTFRDGKAKCSLSGNRTIKRLLVSRQMLKRRGGVVPFPSVAVRQWGELCSWAALMFWVHE